MQSKLAKAVLAAARGAGRRVSLVLFHFGELSVDELLGDDGVAPRPDLDRGVGLGSRCDQRHGRAEGARADEDDFVPARRCETVRRAYQREHAAASHLFWVSLRLLL